MIRNLQSLRFVFFLLVFLSHSTSNFVSVNFDFGGDCGVSFFFVLSGFAMSLGYGQRVAEGSFSTRRLLARQLRKLYPLHVATFVIAVLLDWRGGIFDGMLPLTLNFLLVQTWLPLSDQPFVANGVSWFLCDMAFCYIVFSPLCRRVGKCAPQQLLLWGIVLLIGYVGLVLTLPKGMANHILYTYPLLRMLDFLLGIVLCRFYRWRRKSFTTNVHKASLYEFACLLLLAMWSGVYYKVGQLWGNALTFWPVVPLLLCQFALNDQCGGLLTKILHSNVMLWLGSISFEMYMLHALVIRLVWHGLCVVHPNYLVTLGRWDDWRCVCALVVALLATVALGDATKRATRFLWHRVSVSNCNRL